MSQPAHPPLLEVIIGSTRPERVGDAIARWFLRRARDHGAFEVELIDLAEVNLPLLDEPREPSEGNYQLEHTRRWSATVARADAFVFVVPEYNHSYNAATKNALDFLYHEWRYKGAGLVCYGGGARGTRAAQHLKPVLNSLRLIHAGDVAIGLDGDSFVDGEFPASPQLDRAAVRLMNELTALTSALRPLRDSP
ncbi:MAG TPA: NAD(P)H-dependent oxidoreductase [Acidimicrobiales bacterium]|nr:NAD(P)H-dependent oxidoreductase [Acidimicrobiales bacterium]